MKDFIKKIKVKYADTAIKNKISYYISKIKDNSSYINILTIRKLCKVYDYNTDDNKSQYSNIYDIEIPLICTQGISEETLVYLVKTNIEDFIKLAQDILVKRKFITEEHLKYLEHNNMIITKSNLLIIKFGYKHDNVIQN